MNPLFFLISDMPINDQLSISANWVLTIVVAIVGFFLIRTLNKMEKAIEQHGEQIAELKTKAEVHSQKIDNIEETHPMKVAELIYAKIKAAQG